MPAPGSGYGDSLAHTGSCLASGKFVLISGNSRPVLCKRTQEGDVQSFLKFLTKELDINAGPLEYSKATVGPDALGANEQ